MPEEKIIRKKTTIQVPTPKQVVFSEENSGMSYNPHKEDFRNSKQRMLVSQKTLRIEDDLFQAVKLVAKSLDMTEQDYIIEAIKKETNLHLARAKEHLMAQIANMPSIL